MPSWDTPWDLWVRPAGPLVPSQWRTPLTPRPHPLTPLDPEALIPEAAPRDVAWHLRLPLKTLPRGRISTDEFDYWMNVYTHLILEWPYDLWHDPPEPFIVPMAP